MLCIVSVLHTPLDKVDRDLKGGGVGKGVGGVTSRGVTRREGCNMLINIEGSSVYFLDSSNSSISVF